MKRYYFYIMTNKRNGTLYVGVTNNIVRRIYEHKNKLQKGFTKKYNLTLLVHFEVFNYVKDAISREKQIKKWNRNWKLNLIEKENPMWFDLSEQFTGVE